MKSSPRALLVVLAGASSLLVELTILRYLPGQIRVLGYFTNFVLLAAFVGMGVGMLGVRRWPVERISQLGPIAVLALVALAHLGRGIHVGGSADEVLFLEYSTVAALKIPLYPFLFLAYVVIALAFVPIGTCVGLTLDGGGGQDDNALKRYAWNIIGSLIGIALFAAVSALGLSPPFWAAFASGSLLVLLVLFFPASRRKSIAVNGFIVALTIVLVWRGSRDAEWSPYQKITTAPAIYHSKGGLVQEWNLPRLSSAERALTSALPKESGFVVRVNDDSYQTPLDLRDDALKAYPQLAGLRTQYDLPYTARPPGRVLVLGAGTGNDVAAALRMGATSVDAVEIDAEILKLGADHPEHPYADPRVTTHLTDARSFLSRGSSGSSGSGGSRGSSTHLLFDTIVYGLLDSHVLISGMSNMRLDSYVFTTESFALAKQHLTPATGMLIVSHAVSTPWFADRMRLTLAGAFDGRPPMFVSETVRHPIGYVYAAGDIVPEGHAAAQGTVPLTDDWPFVYLRSRTIPQEYLIAMALMALASIGLVRMGAGARFAGFDVHFFALGAGFLLLETRGLAVLALLVGSTWGVTSLVFAGVLTMAFLSTVVAGRIKIRPKKNDRTIRLVYMLLAALLLLATAVNVGDLLSASPVVRAILGSLLISLPLLASGVVFSTSLVRTAGAAGAGGAAGAAGAGGAAGVAGAAGAGEGGGGGASRALASNLIGAVAGGLAEYLSMVIGFRLLVIVAAVFYALAFATRPRAVRATIVVAGGAP
jgi:hypothetical protein